VSDHSEAKLWEVLEDIRTCMLSTEKDGRIQSRPMSAYIDRDQRCIWFITELTSEKTREIGDGDAVNVAFADNEDSTWVAVEGHARVVRDVAKQKALWNPFAEAYLPQGPESPDVGLIRIDPVEATWWDSPSSKAVQLWQVAVANVTQTPPSDDGTHNVRFA
jgi:general stress protein 26